MNKLDLNQDLQLGLLVGLVCILTLAALHFTLRRASDKEDSPTPPIEWSVSIGQDGEYHCQDNTGHVWSFGYESKNEAVDYCWWLYARENKYNDPEQQERLVIESPDYNEVNE